MINQKWIFGNRAGLDFSTPIPTPIPSTGIQINTAEGCASICDANGQLLLYTDGRSVWDSTNAAPKATGLLGNSSSTQSAIIVPDPGNAQQYYVFTADGATGGNNHFNGIRINVSSWAWATLASLMTLPSTAGLSATERVTAIQHANCVDYWVITVVQSAVQQNNTGLGVFRVFLVNSSGVHHTGDTAMNVSVGDLGYLKASPNGLRLAMANASFQNVLLYDFDNALGVINLGSLVTIGVPQISGHPRSSYGVEFSPNNDVLYYSLLGTGAGGTASTNNGYVFQVDLTVPPVSTQVVVYPNPGSGGRYAIGALQLGMDGRIYIAKDLENSLGAILNPNALGPGCTPNMTFITLATGATCQLGLPNLLPNKCPCACEAGACEADINAANQILSTRAGLKVFTIPANGQTLPATCDLAFSNVNLGPIFTLKWGDGLSDHFESDDLEVIYILVHNPYRNLIYRNLIIFDITITPNQSLPGGDDAARIIPAEIACFEEVQPCSYVARDFALILDHAVIGPCQIAFKYCIEEISIVSGSTGAAAFKIDVVAS